MKVLAFVTLLGVTLVSTQEVPMSTTGSTMPGNTSPLPTGTPSGSLGTTQFGNMVTGTTSGGMSPTSGSPGSPNGTTGANSGSMRTTLASLSTTSGNSGTTPPGGMNSNSGNMGTSFGNVRTSPGIYSTTMATVATSECNKKKKKKNKKHHEDKDGDKGRNKRQAAVDTAPMAVNKTMSTMQKLMGTVMNTSDTVDLQRYTRAPHPVKFK